MQVRQGRRFAGLSSAIGIVAVAACLAGATAPAKDGLSIDTAAGTVIGTSVRGIETWLGVPYAAPPVGALRWRPPEPAKPWASPIKADTLPSSCAQNADLGVFARAGGQEDCLYLNVYRSVAARRSGRGLPVFVWFHGGASKVGQAADYDMTKLVSAGQAIVVAPNYRLGVFGYLAHSALDGEGHPFGNYGLMDQQLALRWVQRNIAKFGGDPGNVTIAGESSGGNSVMVHIASPTAAGTFQHAVAMSGAAVMARWPAPGAVRPLDVAERVGADFAKAVGCETGGAACLRALSTRQILDAQQPYVLNQSIQDGTVLPMHPADAYRTGQLNRVTLVAGSTHDEGRFFLALTELTSGTPLTAAGYTELILKRYGPTLGPQVLREYPLERYPSPAEAAAASNTDSLFACTQRALNRVLSAQMPVYAYEFSDATAPRYIGPTSFPLLAAHTHELAYIFPGFHGAADVVVRLNPAQEALSDQMVGFFTTVAKRTAREREWPRYDPAQDNYMTFALPKARMVAHRFADEHHCALWDRSGLY